MSSLKHIMDVDVDVAPLQSQAYRKAKEGEEHSSSPPVDRSSPGTSSSFDNRDEFSIKHQRRQIRGSQPPTQTVASMSSGMQPYGSSHREPMDFQQDYRAGSSELVSTVGSMQQTTLRGAEPTPKVTYTRVTRRISKAKKGLPVHTCDICKPPKVSSCCFRFSFCS